MDTITGILEESSPPRVFQIEDLVQHALAYPGEVRVPPFTSVHLLRQIAVLAEEHELLGVVTNAGVWAHLRKDGREFFEVTTKVPLLKAGILAYWKADAAFPVGVSRSIEGPVVYVIKKGGECIAWQVDV